MDKKLENRIRVLRNLSLEGNPSSRRESFLVALVVALAKSLPDNITAEISDDPENNTLLVTYWNK